MSSFSGSGRRPAPTASKFKSLVEKPTKSLNNNHKKWEDQESSGYSSFGDDDDEEDDGNNHMDSDDDGDEESEEQRPNRKAGDLDQYSDDESAQGDYSDNYYDDNDDADDDDAPEEESSSNNRPVTQSNVTTSHAGKTNKVAAKQPPKINPNVPLFRLLAKQKQQEKEEDDGAEDNNHRRNKKRKLSASGRQDLYRQNDDNNSDNMFGNDSNQDDQPQKKKKHAPAEMRSDKPVRRLRVDSNAQKAKFVDPRFLDYTGELNHTHYSKNYEFLDEMRENEVQILSKKLRKAKGGKREKISQELNMLKQQLNERKLGKKVMQRIEAFKQEDRDKIKQGLKSTPFFLKNSDKKRLMAEEKYAQLKSTGKVNRYLQKKERKQQAAINQSIPMRRGFDDN